MESATESVTDFFDYSSPQLGALLYRFDQESFSLKVTASVITDAVTFIAEAIVKFAGPLQ